MVTPIFFLKPRVLPRTNPQHPARKSRALSTAVRTVCGEGVVAGPYVNMQCFLQNPTPALLFNAKHVRFFETYDLYIAHDTHSSIRSDDRLTSDIFYTLPKQFFSSSLPAR